MGCDEAIIATWVTRTVFCHPSIVVYVKVVYSFFIEQSLYWVYGAIDVIFEVVLSEFATYSCMGCDEAIIATWVPRTGSDYLIVVV